MKKSKSAKKKECEKSDSLKEKEHVTALSLRSVYVVIVLYFVILPANVCLFSRTMTCVCVSVSLYVFRNTSVHTHTRLVTSMKKQKCEEKRARKSKSAKKNSAKKEKVGRKRAQKSDSVKNK